jgi:hypothetical protein
MEIKKLNLPHFIEKNPTSNREDDDSQINRIIESSKNLKNVSIEKNLDWLNFFFEDQEVKELFLNNERTKSLITIQCLYYLNIFRNLHLAKYKNSKPGLDQIDNESNLPLLNSKSKLIPSVEKKAVFKNMLSTLNEGANNTNKTLLIEKNDPGVKLQNYFKIGLIGCGNVGNFLAKHLIAIKDSSIMNYKILISTRRPNMVDTDIINSIDDNIEIFLDNEKIFQEANLIYLCLLPHQMDLLIKEVSSIFKERIDKLKKKKNVIFPTIVSCLCSVPLDRLRSLFPEEVNIHRTFIDPKLMKKLTDEKFYDQTFNMTKSISEKLILRSLSIGGLTDRSDCENSFANEKVKKGGVILNREIHKYSEEAYNHLFSQIINNVNYNTYTHEKFSSNLTHTIQSNNHNINFNTISSVINNTSSIFTENLLKAFHYAFFSIRKRNELSSDNNFYHHNATSNQYNKYTFTVEENFSFELLKSILGEENTHLINSHFVLKNGSASGSVKIKEECKEEVLKEVKKNFLKIMRSIFKLIENY